MLTLFTLVLDLYLFEKVVNFLIAKLPKPNLKYLVLISVTLLFILIHIVYFLSTKQENLFEFFNVPRVFDLEELKANYKKLIILNHPDKKGGSSNDQIDYFQSIKEDYAFLSNGDFRTLYDKYNERKMEQGVNVLSHTLMYSKVIENLVYYLILLVISAFATAGENLKSGRKWLVAILVLFYSIEVTYILYEKNQKDFLDFIFPKMTLFERIELGRDVLFTSLTSVRLNYKLFYVSPLKKVQAELKKLTESQEGLRKKLLSMNKNLDKNLESIEDQLKQANYSMETQEVKKPVSQSSSRKSYAFYVVMVIFLGLVYLGSKQAPPEEKGKSFEFDFED